MKKIMALVLCLAIAMSMAIMPAAADNAYRTLYSGEITSLNYLTTATTNEFALAANRAYQADMEPKKQALRVDPFDNQGGELERAGAELPLPCASWAAMLS